MEKGRGAKPFAHRPQRLGGEWRRGTLSQSHQSFHTRLKLRSYVHTLAGLDKVNRSEASNAESTLRIREGNPDGLRSYNRKEGEIRESPVGTTHIESTGKTLKILEG